MRLKYLEIADHNKFQATWSTLLRNELRKKHFELTLHHVLSLRCRTGRVQIGARAQKGRMSSGCGVVVRPTARYLGSFHHFLIFTPSVLEPYFNL